MASFVGLKLKKEFEGHGAFEGEVVKFDKKDPLYPFQVKYIDGDQEDLSREELLQLLTDPVPAEEEDAPKGMKAAARSVKPSATTPTQPASKRPRRSLNKSPATTSEVASPASGRATKARGATTPKAEAKGKASAKTVKSPASTGKRKRGAATSPAVKSPSAKKTHKANTNLQISRTTGQNPRFSSTVTYNGVVYVAGEVASDTSDSSVKGQLAQCLKQVDAKLHSAGSSKSRLLRVTLVVSDISKVAEVNEAWDEWVDASQRPVRATFQGQLVDPKYVVEVIAEAAIGQAQIAEPAPLPQPEPVPVPEAEPAPEPMPEPAAEPAPEPTPEPAAEPAPQGDEKPGMDEADTEMAAADEDKV